MADKQVEFVGKIVRQTYDSESYKMYACDIDRKKYPDIKFTKYGNAIIGGNLHSLVPETEYFIRATERSSPKGYSYQVLNIKKTELKTEQDVYLFLREILTEKQAAELYREYPNIVDLVVNDQSNQVDLNKLHGIGYYTFNIIKNKIIENYALFDVINEFKGVLTMSMLKKLYDKYPSIEKIRSEMRVRPYTCLCSLSRVGFKTADALLLELEDEGIIKFEFDLKTSKERCNACITYFLDQNELEGNTKMKIVDLRKQVMKLVPACTHHFVDCLNGNSDIYYTKETMEIALRNTYETEKYIAESLIERLKVNNKWCFDIERYRNIDSFDLSDEQMGFLQSVCDNNITVLSAPGGSGKSFSTKAVINMLKDNNKSFLLASPTGKAAKKLSQYTEEDANTIHRTLCYQDGVFQYNEENQFCTDVLMVDEIGMTDIFLFKALLKATPLNTKIVLIGDKYQLNSVGCGALLRDLISTSFISQVNFTKIFRMGKGGVLTACTYTRNNHKFINEDKITQIGEDKSYTFIPSTSENINNKIVQVYSKLLEKYEAKDITVISSYNVGNNGCAVLNKLLQPIANKNVELKGEHITIKQDKLDVNYYVGDLVINTVNNYHAKIYYGDNDFSPFDENDKDKECLITNGEQGVITKIIPSGFNKGIVIDFDGVEIYYPTSELQAIKHSFSVSTHKMQGSQNKIILFCCPSSHMFMLSNNLMYTSLSRAEKIVYHFSDARTINIAMKKSDSEKRQTMLGDLLSSLYK